MALAVGGVGAAAAQAWLGFDPVAVRVARGWPWAITVVGLNGFRLRIPLLCSVVGGTSPEKMKRGQVRFCWQITVGMSIWGNGSTVSLC